MSGDECGKFCTPLYFVVMINRKKKLIKNIIDIYYTYE